MSVVAIKLSAGKILATNDTDFYYPPCIERGGSGFVLEEQPPAFRYFSQEEIPGERNLHLAERIVAELTTLGLSAKQITKHSGISRKTITSVLKKTRQRINSNTFQSIINFYLMFHYVTLCHDENDLENLALINRAMALG